MAEENILNKGYGGSLAQPNIERHFILSEMTWKWWWHKDQIKCTETSLSSCWNFVNAHWPLVNSTTCTWQKRERRGREQEGDNVRGREGKAAPFTPCAHILQWVWHEGWESARPLTGYFPCASPSVNISPYWVRSWDAADCYVYFMQPGPRVMVMGSWDSQSYLDPGPFWLYMSTLTLPAMWDAMTPPKGQLPNFYQHEEIKPSKY